MIGARAQQQRTRNLLIFGLILSVLIHLIGGVLWGLLARTLTRIMPKTIVWGSLQKRSEPITDRIRLERRAPTPARQAHENRVAVVKARPHPVATTAPSSSRPKHELAHVRIHAPAQPRVTAAAPARIEAPRHTKPITMAPVPVNRPAYSDRQLAELGQAFSKTIADSRETLAEVQVRSEGAPVVATVKHYSIHYSFDHSGIHEGMNPGDGDIFPISKQRIGDTMWYYARYTYIHADGTYESDTIPWPIHYPVNDDPFARGDKRVQIQPPPEGYKPDRPLKPILAQYFGGPPPD